MAIDWSKYGEDQAAAPAPDPDFKALSLAEKLDRNAHDAMNHIHARLKTADPNDPDVQRLKATDSIAQNTVLHKIRVDEPSVRQREDNSRQGEVRRKIHHEVIRLMIEKGQLPPDAMDRFNALLEQGIDSGMASQMFLVEAGLMK